MKRVASVLSFGDRCADILTTMSTPSSSVFDLLAKADDAPQNEKRPKEYGITLGDVDISCSWS